MILHQPYTDELYMRAVKECLTKERYGDIHHHYARLIISECFRVLNDMEEVYETNFSDARGALLDYWSE